MNILIIHEVDYLKKVVFEFQMLAEQLSLMGHDITVIDYEDTWQKDNWRDFGMLDTFVIENIHGVNSKSKIRLIHSGFIKIPIISRISAIFTQYLSIRRTIEQNKIDAIFLYSVPTNGWLAVHLAHQV